MSDDTNASTVTAAGVRLRQAVRAVRPTITTPPRPRAHEPDKILYLRSYLLVRLIIGVVGLLLPIALPVSDRIMWSVDIPRASVSAYYHSGMRDLFVGGLCTIAFFLITYHILHYNWDNVLSTLAGVAALAVALFPTTGGTSLTPLQERMGETLVARIHLVSATVFILSLACLSYLFGLREGQRPDRTTRREFWQWFHWGCSLAILTAVSYILVTNGLGRYDEYSLFFGEAAAALAFGLSWLMKGLELDWLFNRHQLTPPQDASALASEFELVPERTM